MSSVRFVSLAAVLAAACATAPAPIDVTALVAKRGPVDARRDLEIRVLANPRDVQARLAVAALADQLGRPSEAIDELEAVQRLGGPLGARWHADDRARLARLLLARGRARLVRGSANALRDLTRARELGATVPAGELAAARGVMGLVELRHVDSDERATGRATLAALVATGDPSWVGARPTAPPDARARFGAWAWWHGARREAYEQLAAWHDATKPPRDLLYQTLYLRARAWWSPVWLAGTTPDDRELVGSEACRVACDATAAIGDPDAERALLSAPMTTRTAVPEAATAFAAITLRAALRGDGSWGRLLFARVDSARLPRPAHVVFARLAGRRDAGGDVEPMTSADDHLVVAAARALGGGSVASVRAALGKLAETDDGRAVLAIVEPAPAYTGADPRSDAAARFARGRMVAIVTSHGMPQEPGAPAMRAERVEAAGVPAEAVLAEIAHAFQRDPSVAERLARELVARSVDAALGHATAGALFDALGDPARARAEWQAAADASDEPAFAAGLAEAMAHTGDGDAALVIATGAAAASGDPAVVWVAVGRALLDTHRTVDALTAAGSAIDLAGPDAIGDALDLAIEASTLAERTSQAEALAARRARVAPPSTNDHAADDPTDAVAARQALAQLATASTIARAWVASRWNPRDVELRAALLAAIAPDDPRRGALIAELVTLAGDPDHARALDAALALR